MTDQQIVTGPGGIAEDSGTLGLNLYAYINGTLQTLFSSPDLGQGSGALAWLAGDFLGLGSTQIAQPWDDNGALGLNIYGTVGGNFGFASGSADLGQGSSALAWLTGDFTGTGLTQIAQPWDNGGTLGLNVYGRNADGVMQTLSVSSDMGQGSGALAWLTGDFLGSGSTQIAQLWNDNGILGLNIYGNAGGGSVQTLSASSDMGQGSSALAWLAGDFIGSGSAQILQLWDNDGTLGLNIYGNAGGGSVQTLFVSNDMGQGSGALAWLADYFISASVVQIAQLWDDNGALGLNVYASADGKVATAFSYPDLGQGSAALAWLTGDFTGKGSAEIAQPWDNNGNLEVIIYATGTAAPGQAGVNYSDLGQGSGALAWLTGDFTGMGLAQIAQLWAS